MSGRRNHARFFVSSNDGMLQVAHDVSAIWIDGELIAISTVPATAGDALRIEVIVGGLIEQFIVRVEESQPIVVAGVMRHRIRLTHVDPGRPSNAGWQGSQAISAGGSPAGGPAHGQSARLSRNTRVRVVNCSDAACLLEADDPVAVNTVAGLQVRFGRKLFDDVVRVVRCESPIDSRNIHLVAVVFLSVTPAYAGSLRSLMRQEIGDLDRSAFTTCATK